MAFYDLSKQDRAALSEKITGWLRDDLMEKQCDRWTTCFSDPDTYIRKAAYQAAGKIYRAEESLRMRLLSTLVRLQTHSDPRVRQTAINAAGEIGKKDFGPVQRFFDKGLFDAHHSPRNAVIGCVKKMGEVNPDPVLEWARKYLHHPEKEIRREVCHGIELRGRKHPGDILPLLRELQHDKTARVRNTLVHVIGQIAYKKGCLETVVAHLKTWENRELVQDALAEIIDVHGRYSGFAALSQAKARAYIKRHFS